ncbi:MAG: DUF362 domain-containing protein [bacterium]|nr:DUF362 domain-containing protein [bacterium]
MSKVALVRCDSYDFSAVKKAVEQGITLIGGVEQFARKGETVVLKPNLLSPDPPEKCVTTHPAVFRAVAELFLTTGATIKYGDSPANFASGRNAARKAGLADHAEELSIEWADFENAEEIYYEKGIQNKIFPIARGVLDSDGLISLPKLKTHALSKMTGAVKNQFGCIPGIKKGEYHVKLPDANDFAKMLVDLNNFILPRLYVMDGIYAMEGNGPKGGKPLPMNVLLFSKDPVALDATVCRLVNVKPDYVPTIQYGYETGTGTYLETEIELLGDPLEDFMNTAFNVDRDTIKAFKAKGAMNFLSNRLVSKPFIRHKKCAMCGLCIQMCPVAPKGIDWKAEDRSKPPVYNFKNCIRCYCCQEICPEGAIELKKPFLRKILRKIF